MEALLSVITSLAQVAGGRRTCPQPDLYLFPKVFAQGFADGLLQRELILWLLLGIILVLFLKVFNNSGFFK